MRQYSPLHPGEYWDGFRWRKSPPPAPWPDNWPGGMWEGRCVHCRQVPHRSGDHEYGICRCPSRRWEGLNGGLDLDAYGWRLVNPRERT